jgi:hypothetical protein
MNTNIKEHVEEISRLNDYCVDKFTSQEALTSDDTFSLKYTGNMKEYMTDNEKRIDKMRLKKQKR